MIFKKNHPTPFPSAAQGFFGLYFFHSFFLSILIPFSALIESWMGCGVGALVWLRPACVCEWRRKSVKWEIFKVESPLPPSLHFFWMGPWVWSVAACFRSLLFPLKGSGLAAVRARASGVRHSRRLRNSTNAPLFPSPSTHSSLFFF